MRKVLNYGHTVGHAIETFCLNTKNRKDLTHGHSIALGMIIEGYISTVKLNFDKKLNLEINRFLLINFEKKIYTKNNSNIWFSFVIGMAFGFGWTPCIGPILGSILALASTEETILKAVILLSFYSLGLAIPFILSGYLMQRFLIFSKSSFVRTVKFFISFLVHLKWRFPKTSL